MNLLMRAMICRQSPLLLPRRPLSTEKSRRALRSSLFTEKLRAPTPSSPRNTNQNPFPFVNERNVIMGIIAANGVVFLAWKFSYANLKSNMDQRFLWFMTKHFSMSSLYGTRRRLRSLFSGILGRCRSKQSRLDAAHVRLQPFRFHTFSHQ